MIKINRNFEELAKFWFDKIMAKNGKEKNLKDRINEHINSPNSFFNDDENIRAIITCEPEVIIQLSLQLSCKFPDLFVKKGKEKSKIEKVFNYDFFIDKYGYELSKKIGVNVCPYCNRNFTNTVTHGKNKVIRPDFDHFFLKDEHPLLALSFYNLIPSCQICNSRLKGEKPFDLKNYFHPYIDGFEDEVSFNYLPNSTKGVYGVQSDFKIIFEEKTGKYKDKIKGSNDVFKFDKIYEYHGDIIEELVAKIYKGSQSYLESIYESFPGLNLTKPELYRLAYGNYMDEADFEKRPFAKITKDIFDSLKGDLDLMK
jgi:hypothetical protein